RPPRDLRRDGECAGGDGPHQRRGGPLRGVASARPGRRQEESMTIQQIFGLQVLLSFVLFALIARWYVSPRLAALPVDRALQPLLVLHASRHRGLVFLVPTVVGGTLPPAFAAGAGYGDLLAGLLALAALVALRARVSVA